MAQIEIEKNEKLGEVKTRGLISLRRILYPIGGKVKQRFGSINPNTDGPLVVLTVEWASSCDVLAVVPFGCECANRETADMMANQPEGISGEMAVLFGGPAFGIFEQGKSFSLQASQVLLERLGVSVV